MNPPRATTADTEGGGEVKEANALTSLLNEFNGGIDDANMRSTFSGYAMYKDIRERGNGEAGTAGNAFSAATFVLGVQQISGLPAPVPQGFYFDPADYAAAGRTTKLRLRVSFFNNAVATGLTFVFGLYPVATYGGSSGNPPTIATLGAVTAGSTVTFTTPPVSPPVFSNSGDFTPPAAGWYAIGLTASGAGPANSFIGVRAALQVRQV